MNLTPVSPPWRSSGQAPNMHYNPALDGIRAVAVLAVVAYHAGFGGAGFVGVDVFFVISGYLITRLLQEELQATGRIDLMAFYARRARRILPALVAVVLFTLAASSTLPSFDQVAMSAAAAAAFVANLYFQMTTGGYWSINTEMIPLLHLWSLSVEEQFYLVWPLVLILARKRPVGTLVTLAVISFALAEWLHWYDPAAAFYQTPARAWELAVGALVALRPIDLPKSAAWTGLLIVLVATVVPFVHFPGAGALPAVLGAALLVAAVQGGQSPRVLTLKPVVFIGLISYSLYLWHWPLLALERAGRGDESPLAVKLGLCVVAFFFACLSYRYIETPIRRSQAGKRQVVSVALVCAAALSCGAFAFAHHAKPKLDAATLAEMDFPANRYRCHQQWRHSPVAPPSACQTRPGAPEVVIWGDSMAMAWQPFAYALADHGHKVGASYTRDACPPILEFAPEQRRRQDELCRQFNRVVFDRAKQAETVILAARWVDYFKSGQASGLEPIIRSLRSRAIVIGPTPELPKAVPDCMRAHDTCAISRASFERESAQARLALTALAAKYQARYVDPTDFFCDHERCSPSRQGDALYWDSHHVSSTAARAFAARYLSGRD